MNSTEVTHGVFATDRTALWTSLTDNEVDLGFAMLALLEPDDHARTARVLSKAQRCHAAAAGFFEKVNRQEDRERLRSRVEQLKVALETAAVAHGNG